jgi:hypothetical protein
MDKAAEHRPRHGEEFSVPMHVIKEIGSVAGDNSKASSLINAPASSEKAGGVEQDKDIEAWALQNIGEAIGKWNGAVEFQGTPHWTFRGAPVPTDLKSLEADCPDFKKTFSSLCEAKKKLLEFGGKTPSGLNIGETMDFVLLPWRFFSYEMSNWGLEDNPSLYYTLIELQGFNDFNTEIFENLRKDNIRYRSSSTPEEYLEEKIARDGNWGIMLMQTSADPGLDPVDEPAYPATLQKSRDLRFLGHNISNLGFFEAIAYSLQEKRAIQHDEAWLPANTFPDDNILNPNMTHKSKVQNLTAQIRGNREEKRQIRFTVDGR